MGESNANQTFWSLESSERSFNDKFEDLEIKDCEDDDNGMIARGNSVKNSHKKAHKQRKSTSVFVQTILKDAVVEGLELSKSSGFGSISPTNDCCLHKTYNFPIECKGVFQGGQQCGIKQVCNQSTKRTLINILKGRLSKKKNDGSENFIFEFGDTNLIKSCRKGQLAGVQEALNDLAKHYQLSLIDHQNASNETALSIATYQMNEPLIKLLLSRDATPTMPLTMRNNVLHLAASMTNDPERRSLKYLIRAINQYQPESLLAAVTDKNIFNYDVCGILMCYRDNMTEDPYIIQDLIAYIQQKQSNFYET